MIFSRASIVALFGALLAAAQGPILPRPPVIPPAIHFVDIGRASGLTGQNVFGGRRHKSYIVEVNGNGVVIFDYNNDGWPDIFIPNGSKIGGFPPGKAPIGQLYRNNRDGTFTDVAVKAGLTASGWGQGGCAGDLTNDGYPDLLITFWGQNRLYHNNGNGTFTDITRSAGLLTPKREWSTGCSFLDFDRDGFLDLFLARYVDFSFKTVPKPGQGRWCQWKGLSVECGPRGLKGGVDALYRNNGNDTFSDVSARDGVTHPTGYYGFTPLVSDFSHDGWPDIYVADDSTPNILFHNNGKGRKPQFTDIAAMAGVAYNADGAEQAGMGVAADDYLHTGSQDIVKTNFSDDTPTLYFNHGDGDFDDVTYEAGLGKITCCLGWGVQFMDFDNSGWPDILMAQGHVYPEVDHAGIGETYKEPKVAYYNLRNGTFANITAQAGRALNRPELSRGMAVADLFNDGHQEAVVVNMAGTPSIYYNTAPVGHFISLQLVGRRGRKALSSGAVDSVARQGSNRSAIGAEVTLFMDHGKDRREQEVRSSSGFLSQDDLRLHFGLGSATEAEKIVIRWPSGLVETLRHLPADRYYVVDEGEGIDPRFTHGVSGLRYDPALGRLALPKGAKRGFSGFRTNPYAARKRRPLNASLTTKPRF